MMRKIKLLYIITSFKQSGPINQLFYIIKNLDRTVFEPYLLKLNNENNSDEIEARYKNYVDCELVNTNKIEILVGYNRRIRKKIDQIQPDVIHTLGLFPDFLVEKLGFKNHILTLRDFCYVGHIDKYGILRGKFMIAMQEYVMKHCKSVITCSESLSNLYYEKLNRRFPYIRNGVDTRLFSHTEVEGAETIRRKFGLNDNDTIFIYSGQFIERKNHKQLVLSFKNVRRNDIRLMLLGGGPLLSEVKELAADDDRILFTGNVDDVVQFLSAADIYVSTSRSEGMPNGVLEAMSCGIPVLLSDIEQHKEIFEVCPNIGVMYSLDSDEDLSNKIELFSNYKNLKQLGYNAHETAVNQFSDSAMSSQYQKCYKNMVSN